MVPRLQNTNARCVFQGEMQGGPMVLNISDWNAFFVRDVQHVNRMLRMCEKRENIDFFILHLSMKKDFS